MSEAKIIISAEDRTGAALNSVAAGVSRVAGLVEALGVTLSVGYFVDLIRGSIDAADRLGDLSKSTDIAVEDLAGLKLLAKQSGTDLEGLAKGINRMSVEIGKNPEKFRALGVTAKDNAGAFRQFADVFKLLPDVNQRNALAQAVFNRSWHELAPALSEGSKKIGEVMEKGARLSASTKELTASSDAFNDKLAELTGTGGLLNRQIAPLLPLLNAMADDLIDLRDNSADADGQFHVLAETFRAMVVFGGNVAFAFRGIGRELGGLMAQADTLGVSLPTMMQGPAAMAAAMIKATVSGEGSAKRFAAIGEQMREDARKDREEFDKWERKMMSVSTALTAVGDTSDALSRKLNRDAANEHARQQAAAAAKAAAFLADQQATKDAQSGYDALIKRINEKIAAEKQELATNRELTEFEKFEVKTLAEMDATKKTLTATQKAAILGHLAEAKALDLLTLARKEDAKQNIALNKFFLDQNAELAADDKARTDARDQVNKAIYDQTQALADSNAMLKMEGSLLGVTDREREIALGNLRIDLELRRQEEELGKNLLLNEEQRGIARARLYGNAETQRAMVAERASIDEFQRVWGSIDQTAHDTFVNIFEGGTNVFKKLGQTLKASLLDLLYQMTVKKWIFQIYANVSGGATGAMAGQGGMFGMASNGFSLYNGMSSAGTIGSQVFGGSMSVANGAGTMFANAAGTGIDGLLATNGAYGTAAGSGAGAGAGGAGAAAAPFAAILLPLFAAYADGFFSGEKRGGGQYGYSLDGTTVANARRGTQQAANGVGATYLEGPDGGDPAAEATKLVINSTVAGINDALRSFGSQATLTGYQAAYETSQQGKGGVFAGGRLSTGAAFGESGAGSNEPGSNGADPSRSLYEMWGAQIGAFGTTGLDTNGSPEKLATDAAQSYIEAIQASAGLIPRIVREQYQRDLSGSTSGYTFGATMGGGDGAESVTDPTVTTFRRVYDDAMKASARELGLLPKRILDLVIDVDPEALSAEATAALSTKIQALVNNVNGFHAIVDTLPVKELRSASFDAAAALVELSGGLEKFAANVSSYVDNFYSDEEKRRAIASNISATLAGAGIDVSADTLLTTTREQFRAVAEGQDVVTESGQRAKAALMSVAPAFASITKEAISASEQLRATIDTQRDTITSQRAYARELREYRDGLLLGDKSPLNVFDRKREAERQFNATLAGAQAGDATARGALTGAIDNYLSAGLASAHSKTEYDAIFARVSTALTITAAGADSQATVAEQQLGVLESQLDALGAININVESLAAAFDAYTSTQTVLDAAKASAQAAAQAAADATVAVFGRVNSAQAPTPVPDALVGGSGAQVMGGLWDPSNSFAAGTDYFPGGIRLVGEGGPELENTGPSRIFSASQTRDILSGGGGSQAATVDEIRQLRAQVAQLIEATRASTQHAFRAAKVLDQLNIRGVQVRDRDDQTTLSVHVV